MTHHTSEQSENTPKTYSEQEYNALKTQLESLKQSAKESEDFKKKWEQSEKERKDFEHITKISAYFHSLGLKNYVYEKYISKGTYAFNCGYRKHY